jgi:protoporphyrinogen oxidase
MRVGIIGAGPAGLTCAYQLTKAGIETDLYEASASVGGLAKTIELWNQRVDLGPHRFFSRDARVNKLWLEIVGTDYLMVDRLTRILYNDRLFRYPIQPLDVITKLGVAETFRCLLSYIRENITPGEPKATEETFESWVVRRFGRRLFEIFFKTYSEKLWGISCDELDADFAAQRIKKFSLYEALKSALLINRPTEHNTLVEQFAYPHEGTGTVYERMASFVSRNGGNIYLNTPIDRVMNFDGGVRGLELVNGIVENYDHVVSSMPLTQLVLRLKGADESVINSAKSLRFRNTILVYLKVQNETLFPDNWVYVHSKSLKLGRITNFRNWSPNLYGEEKSSIVALEYWCNDSDELWSMDDNKLIELGRKEFVETGLARREEIADGHIIRIHRCYPVYRKGYKEILKPIVNYLRQIGGLTVIGRYGSFKYNNQDHSILMGMLAAENITGDAKNDLWAINTDYEYQEEALITETGLVELNSSI